MAKVMMVYKVLIEKELQKEVAKEHRVSPHLVGIYVRKALKNKDMLSELLQLRQETAHRRQTIA